MKFEQLKNASFLFAGQLLIKVANLIKQILLAFFLGVSANIDLLLAAQIVPSILSSMIGGGAGEILITTIRKKAEDNARLVVLFTFCVSVITVAIGGLYLLSVPVWLNVFKVSNESASLFWTLSIIVIINKLPTALVASLKNLLYYKNLYRYYVVTSLVSELIGIGAIVLLVKPYGIIAFALGHLITSTVNAVLFFNIHGLTLKYLFKAKHWIAEKITLIGLLRKVFSLGLQTLINHLSTFWERTLSMRYLTPGYLSALGYSKSLNEMPQMVMLTSILTTTYVEQAKLKNENESEFERYSKKMESILSSLAAAFQFISVIFAPLILIVLFRRGKFDNDAVQFTLVIYQILTVGFLPGVMMNFLSRTMYVIGKYKQLLFFIVIKFLIMTLTMYFFINSIAHAIPLAIVLGRFFHSIALFFYIGKAVPDIFNKKRFVIIYTIIIALTIVILFANQWLLPMLLTKTTFEILLIYIPVMLVCGVVFIWYVNHLGYLKPAIQRVKKSLYGRRN